MTDIDHGPYSGVVDIARNGIDEVIRLRALNAELVEALRGIVALWDHHSSAHGDNVIFPLHEQARAALARAEAQR